MTLKYCDLHPPGYYYWMEVTQFHVPHTPHLPVSHSIHSIVVG